MQLHIAPILRTIARRRAAAALLAVEIAFSVVLTLHSSRLQRRWTALGVVDEALAAETLYLVGADGTRDDRARLLSLPHVTSVARADHPPHTTAQAREFVRAPSTGHLAIAWPIAADPQLVTVLGARITDGAPLAEALPGDEAQKRSAEPVLITASLARDLFGSATAVGEIIESPWRARPLCVAGVISDVPFAPTWMPASHNGFISALASHARRALYLVRLDSAGSGGEPERAIRSLLADENLITVQTLSARVAGEKANVRGTLIVTTTLVFALLLVTWMGAAAMVSFLVAQRTREIGLRRALGARATEVITHFLVETGLVATGGIAAGLVLAWALAALIGVSPREFDPGVVACVVLAIWTLVLVAAWLPARRAAHVPPSVAGRAP